MTVIYRVFLCCVAGFALTGCAADQIHNEKMIAAARGVDQRFVAAYNRGDVEGVMSNYWNSPDLVVYSPVALQAKGWDAVRAGMAQGLAGSSGARLELTESHYQVAGDVVICWGTWRMNVPSANGFALVVEGRYSDVKAQRNGRWVFIMDHASIPWPLAE